MQLKEALMMKGLSNREIEVAELVAKGLANKEAANVLFVTEKTIKFHLTNIYKKMTVKSRSQLIVWCMQYLIQPPTIALPVPTTESGTGPDFGLLPVGA